MKKNVEVIEKTIKEEIITYIAKDGREFDNENDCKEWENSYQSTALASFNKLHKVESSSIALGCEWSTDYNTVYVIDIRDKNDVVVINSLIDCADNCGSLHFGFDIIGDKVIMECGEIYGGRSILGADWVGFYSYSEHKESLLKEFERVEKLLAENKEVCDGK